MKSPNGNGFSLIEVVVSMVVLTAGMLAMAASTGYISAEIRHATWNTQRSAARELIVEELRAIPFTSVSTSGTARTVGRYSMTWTVVPVGNNLKRVFVIAAGPAYRIGQGARAMVTDTFVVNVARP